jgi:membrane carboxypeptidase/penicillin-binding protein PbpC
VQGHSSLASSTITQQLVKILLNNESDRTLRNKIKELFYAISLEIFNSKEDILKMYHNSTYFGNQIQGLELSSLLYFDKSAHALTEEEILKLIATIDSPSISHPFSKQNIESATNLAKILEVGAPVLSFDESYIKLRRQTFSRIVADDLAFESSSFTKRCGEDCVLTLDKELTENIRNILSKNIMMLSDKKVKNGAVIVIKLPENELLSIVGSTDPKLKINSSQINMALKPRPIGSTLKPFIYLKAFESGLRPYSLVDDKEYRYIIDSGFSFYPKNYDYNYNGIVDLHYALSNSLNVPTVKVLEYLNEKKFRDFLLKELEIKEIQPMENYGLGLALGQLEMDLLNLTYLFTLFPNEGILRPLVINNFDNQEVPFNLKLQKTISDRRYIQLINKILTDRNTGIDQFGMRSSLNFSTQNIGLKTGTSREFHDSFVIGFTPDFVVGVWLGNADNTPMDQVSGQGGAGIVFQEVMNLVINSKYASDKKFNFNLITDFEDERSLGIKYGLKDDNYFEMRDLLLDDNLIITPHHDDVFLLEKSLKIPIKCSGRCSFYEGENFLFDATEGFFSPISEGEYRLKAVKDDRSMEIRIFVNS